LLVVGTHHEGYVGQFAVSRQLQLLGCSLDESFQNNQQVEYDAIAYIGVYADTEAYPE
jgi:hypothetical protein